MATLTNKKIKDTYKSLLKVSDNGNLEAALQDITDGEGNSSGIQLNTAGDLTASGTVAFGELKDSGENITISKFVDEADGIAANDNDTTIPTSAAVKDYVDTKVTAEDLDFAGDTGTGAVDLDSQTFTIAGTANEVVTSASGQTVTIGLPSSISVDVVGNLTGNATTADTADTSLLVNTFTASNSVDYQVMFTTSGVGNKKPYIDVESNQLTYNPFSNTLKVASLTGNVTGNLTGNVTATSVLANGVTATTQASSDNSTKVATTAFVKSVVTAEDLDFAADTGTGAVDLDSQTFTIAGTANEIETSASGQTVTIGLPSSITTNLVGNVTGNVSGNVTGDLTGNADTATALATSRTISLSGDVVGSGSFNGTANLNIAATIQPNSVALGTDTTGDYVSNLGAGTGVTIANNTGEGSNPTITVNYGSTANTSVEGDTALTIQGTANEIEVSGGAVTLGAGGTVTVGLPNNVIIAGDLTVNGTTTTINTQTLSVEDPLIELANQNASNSVDTGFFANYSLDAGVTTKYAGLFKDASDSDKFKLFKGLEVEPATTVDTLGTGYAKGDLVIGALDATSGTISGNLTVDTNTLYVDAINNRVGVGTSSLGANKLTVLNNGDTSDIKISSDTLALLQLEDSGISKVYNIEIGRSGTSGDLTFRSSEGEKVRFTESGNVGIGTQTPDIFGRFYTRSVGIDSAGVTKIQIDGASYSGIDFGVNGTRSGEINNAGSFEISALDARAITLNTNGSERMRIDSSGNVGIGEQNPANNKLVIKDAGDVGVQITKTGVVSGTVKAVSTGLAFGVDTSSGNTERMRIDSSGNVGIGTSSPNLKLHVTQAAGSAQMRLERTVSNAGSMILGADGDGLKIFDGSVNERLRLTQAGNLGIGSTNPTDKLVVIGDVASTGSLKLTGNSSTPSAGAFVHRPASNTLALGTASAERMRITSGGDVLLSAGGNFGTLRNDSVSVGSTPVTVIDFTGQANGIYLATIVRSGGSTAERAVAIIALGAGNTVAIQDVLGSQSYTFSASGAFLQASNANTRTSNVTVQPLTLD